MRLLQRERTRHLAPAARPAPKRTLAAVASTVTVATKAHQLSALLAAALLVPAALAAAPRRDHPLLGSWKIQVPGGQCVETYLFKPDGTSLVTSAREVSQGEFEVSDEPGAAGFYRLRDRIVHNNAQPDCMGSLTPPGSEVQRFLRFDPTGRRFLMCDAENLDACIGPFESDEGEAT